jgi:hypothetical protein
MEKKYEERRENIKMKQEHEDTITKRKLRLTIFSVAGVKQKLGPYSVFL